ncbi:hypothetical protein QR680_017525 [Steinernema hermaphroditum]|uniref:E3 ubiquitin-protein ligase n=1 Tax=Steinernema hermaphroditum TaxID=289476 RepID=A0AA39LPG7_9BILA|nr:hypothetical protein QR680_017525 [Steinernema hermaphroditum]
MSSSESAKPSSSSANSEGPHLQRKRNSPATASHTEGAPASAAVASCSGSGFSKLRKLSRAAEGRTSDDLNPSTSSRASSASTEPRSSPGVINFAPGQGAESPNSRTAYSRQLKHLTDFFPNQQESGDRRLTRSRVRQMGSQPSSSQSQPVPDQPQGSRTQAVRQRASIHISRRSSSGQQGASSSRSSRMPQSDDAAQLGEGSPSSMSFGGGQDGDVARTFAEGATSGTVSSLSFAPSLDNHRVAFYQHGIGYGVPYFADPSVSFGYPNANLNYPTLSSSQVPCSSINHLSSMEFLSSTHTHSFADAPPLVQPPAPRLVLGISSAEHSFAGPSAFGVPSGGGSAQVPVNSDFAPLQSTELGPSAFGDSAAHYPSSSTSTRNHAVHAASAFLGTLVPRMQQFLGGGSSGSSSAAISMSHHLGATNSRTMAILEGLRSSNEIRQEEAAVELAEMLLLGNEESLPNLPVREILQCLLTLLQKEHNFELMLASARCITNMLEALPRSLPVIVEAVPLLLEKLKRIECIDVAEQSLIALEVMSKRNGKNIMLQGGIAATISHVDFFSLPSQRLAFQIAANCALYVTAHDFSHVKDSLTDLTQRFGMDDKRSLESVCLLFSRLVDNMKAHPEKLREIAGEDYIFLKNVQQLLVVQPMSIGSNTFLSLVRTLRLMASKCSDIAVALVKMDFAVTIRTLLAGADSGKHEVELVSRPAPQIHELVALIGELLPRLAVDGIFEIDRALTASATTVCGQPVLSWVWQDDEGQWRPYSPNDNRVIEIARENGENDVVLEIGGQPYTINLASSVQVNQTTGMQRSIARRISHQSGVSSVLMGSLPGNDWPTDHSGNDVRTSLLSEDKTALISVIEQLLPILVQIDSTSSATALRFETLRVIMRMIYAIGEDMESLLSKLPLSGHIAGALSSSQPKEISLVVSGLQLVHLLLEKLPNVYGPVFKKEGIAHLVSKLIESYTPSVDSSKASPSGIGSRLRTRPASSSGSQEDATPGGETSAPPKKGRKTSSDSTGKKEKDSKKRAVAASANSFLSALRLPSFSKTSASHSGGSGKAQQSSMPSESDIKEKVREWVYVEASYLTENYLKQTEEKADSLVINAMKKVASLLELKGNADHGCDALNSLRAIIVTNDITPFELSHSGVIGALIRYLTSASSDTHIPRKLRLKRFAAVFMNLQPDNLRPMEDSSWEPLGRLVAKLIQTIAHLEQFQVRVTDLSGMMSSAATMSSLRGAQALRFFQTHQIRCNLRKHPSDRQLKEWRNGQGSIKVDPFTSISAIERYLVDRGICSNSQDDDSSGDDEMSDDQQEGSRMSVDQSQNGSRAVEIFMGDTRIPSTMSVLQAIRQYSPVVNGLDGERQINAEIIWGTAHTLYFRAAAEGGESSQAGDSIAGTSSSSSKRTSERKGDKKKKKSNDKLWTDGEIPTQQQPLDDYLSTELSCELGSDPSRDSLVLLRTLYGLNRFWWCLFSDEVPPTSHASLISNSQFISTKLNSKVARQLSDFLSVATQQIPQWTKQLVKEMAFLFPFSTRRSLLYCTAFGRDRALTYIMNDMADGESEGDSARPTPPRIERRKITVDRNDLLNNAQTVMSSMQMTKALVEISFAGEAGTGFGPTLEFYSLLSREMQRHSLDLWLGSPLSTGEGDQRAEYTTSPGGLFPKIVKGLSAKEMDARSKRFEFIGRLMGQALLDVRMLDIQMSSVFYKWLLGKEHSISLFDLEMLDEVFYRSLREMSLTEDQDFEYLEQYFTLPGDESFELLKGGRNKAVNKANVNKFIQLVVYWKLIEGVRKEMEAVRRGFNSVVDPSLLRIFDESEMDELFCGCSERNNEKIWNVATLQQSIKPDHGYSHDSPQVQWLIKMLLSFSTDQRRNFLQFATGSTRLPFGGFRSLNPPLKVVKKTVAYASCDSELPSAMTCYNYLKVPPYSSYEVFVERFSVALQCLGFHLT